MNRKKRVWKSINYVNGFTEGAIRMYGFGFPLCFGPHYLPPDKFVCMSRRNRTRHGTTDWFQIGKGVCQGYILSPCLFNLYAEYMMQNAGLDEVQAGIKVAERNIKNLRYAGDTTLMAESEEELKSLLIEGKRGE